MPAEIWTYIVALVGNWAALIWGTSLIFDVGGLVLRKNQYLAITNWLDQYVAEETRVIFLRTLLVIGLLIAGFNAWDGQRQQSQMDWEVLSSTEIKAWATDLSAFKVLDVTIWYVPRDEDVALTVEQAFKDAGWNVREMRESEPILGFAIDVDEDTLPAAAALRALCKQKFDTEPVIQSQHYSRRALGFTIGRRLP